MGRVGVPQADPTKLSRNPQIEEAPLENDLMLFDPASSKFYVLNRTMAFVWRECDGNKTVEVILDRMTQSFREVDRTSASKDLGMAIEQLLSLGLVQAQQG
ncbi:MAG TPA: PqqD family protein [Thermoanaerobaculia bacterium]|nr:PqqD family protein [Thermoanaerobaculia bacterium]